MPRLETIIEAWQEEHKAIRVTESTEGIKNLEKLFIAMGYGSDNPRIIEEQPLFAFLLDNSGAVETLLEWIYEQNIEEWKQNLLTEISEDTEIEDEDEDEDEEDGEFIRVEYDLEYSGGNYVGTGSIIQVPSNLVAKMGMHNAFKETTGYDPIHIVHYES